ncbi:hypothetical protein AAZV13_16G083700 [Glycine max]
MVADEHFVIRIPDSLALDATAPLICAGITVYSPLRYYGLDKPDLHVGVVGLSGLGHMAVKFAKAFGAKVIVISTSPSKKDEAIQHLGADSFLLNRDQDQMQATIYMPMPCIWNIVKISKYTHFSQLTNVDNFVGYNGCFGWYY